IQTDPCMKSLSFCLQSLLETHDSVASKTYETPPPSPCSFMDAALNNQPVPPDAVRMVGIRKVSGEHLVRTHRYNSCQ
ncbi:MAGUK p55 subfamily member 2, partial [Goodea atripinnis]